MFGAFRRYFSTDLAIDLGTANTLIFVRDAASPGGLRLTNWVALDSQNNRTTVRLSNQRLNGPVTDGAFAWDDPRPRKGKG